jgi:hypothetical protein
MDMTSEKQKRDAEFLSTFFCCNQDNSDANAFPKHRPSRSGCLALPHLARMVIFLTDTPFVFCNADTAHSRENELEREKS